MKASLIFWKVLPAARVASFGICTCLLASSFFPVGFSLSSERAGTWVVDLLGWWPGLLPCLKSCLVLRGMTHSLV